MRSAGYHQVCSMNPEASNYDMQLTCKKHGRSYNSNLLLPPPAHLRADPNLYIDLYGYESERIIKYRSRLQPTQ